MSAIDRLALQAANEIGLMRDWLSRLERDLGNHSTCLQAGTLIDLGNAFTKLSYLVGMINKTRLQEGEKQNDSPEPESARRLRQEGWRCDGKPVTRAEMEDLLQEMTDDSSR